MNTGSPYFIETERLRLRKFTTADAPFMFRLVNEPSWLRYIGDRKVHSVLDAEQYLLNGSIRSYDLHGFGFWPVELKSSGEIIGTAGLAKRDYLEDVDLGFAFLPEYAGQGFALESARAIIQYAIQVLKFQKLVAFTTTDNVSSIRLLLKLGFTRNGILMLEGEELNLYELNA